MYETHDSSRIRQFYLPLSTIGLFFDFFNLKLHLGYFSILIDNMIIILQRKFEFNYVKIRG
jgi:hypothetical protein